MDKALERSYEAAIILAAILLGMLMNSDMAQAAGYDTFLVNDYRSTLPLSGANVSLVNGFTELSALTDPQGQADLGSSSTDNWAITITRSGFNPYSSLWTWTNSSKQTYLTPYSGEGIIAIKYVDLTLSGDHESCLFYASNSRLKGCSHLNDTVILHNNAGYIWRPVISKTDLASSLELLEKNLGNYLPALEGLVVLAMFAALLLVIVGFGIRYWRGGRKR